MYSQNNEEVIIGGQFPGVKGRFLDIGAYDGKTFSNTLKLVEQGWSGVCVEASPIVFPKLLELHKDNPNIQLVLAAVEPDGPRLVTWYDSGGDAVSTTELNHVRRWEAGSGVRFSAFTLYTLPLKYLFLKFGFDFEFINIDVESANLALFKAMPWVTLAKTKVVCVEHDMHHEEMKSILEPLGYHQIGWNAENLIMAR